jgi:hypothetical protein
MLIEVMSRNGSTNGNFFYYYNKFVMKVIKEPSTRTDLLDK